LEARRTRRISFWLRPSGRAVQVVAHIFAVGNFIEMERNFLYVDINLCINSVEKQVPVTIPIHPAADVLH
jgi:hypothetical protein